MKKTVFFDLGNVLLFFDHQKMMHQIANVCELEFPVIESLMKEIFDAYERGNTNTVHLHQKLSEMTGRTLCLETLKIAIANIFQPNLASIEIAQELKKKGVKLFLLSNTCDAHFEYARANYPFLDLFDGYILSYEVGARKPEKEIYEKALEIAGCGKEECFYTDDIPEYVQAAQSLMIDSEQFTSAQSLKEHLIARGFL